MQSLKDLLADEARCKAFTAEFDGIYLDYSHVNQDQSLHQLFEKVLAEKDVMGNFQKMFSGEKINVTEKRAVLHAALRSQANEEFLFEGKNVVPEVHSVLSSIQKFSSGVREGAIKGFTGKELTDVVVIGIGGSYLSIEFVYEALRGESNAKAAANGKKLKFLANVDPQDFYRAVEGMNVENTLFVINSKTFTTAETMLNARTCKDWILKSYQALGLNTCDAGKLASFHMCACSTNYADTEKFGIPKERVFPFWDWVGGRFSVSSAIGVLPLSLHFGFDIVRQFLDGMNSIDKHLMSEKDFKKNIPLLLGLIGYYHTGVCGHRARAILPYSQALCKFAPHIQQLDMESNGKRVDKEGKLIDYHTTVVNFGEPGTNGQHSFYQLLHQGTSIIPCEFIGYCQSQSPIELPGEPVSNHDELMSNFFSQPDALAIGKTVEELKAEGVAEELIPHKTFPGNRPSISLLFKQLNAYTCGQLLALYEHRTSVEGFIWNINSYDQYGVELGKVLAKSVRSFFSQNKGGDVSFEGTNFNPATKTLLSHYMQNQK